MKLNDLLLSSKEFSLIDFLRENCSQFIYQSGGFSILKNLPIEYDNFRKIKVRKRKGDSVSEHFNDAFIEKLYLLRQRAVFANGWKSLIESSENEMPYYIFPINGYSYLYQSIVQNSNKEYQKSFNTILETMGNKQGSKVITDMLQFSYIDNENLAEGIESGAEIIIYNIPYFYALKSSSIDDYKNFWNKLSTDSM